MIPIVTPSEMRAIDAAAADAVDVLVQRAGAAVARSARRMMGGTYGRTVNLVYGRGNNGADGEVAADFLAAAGVRVRRFAAADAPHALPPADLVIDAAYGTGFRDEWVPPDVGDTPLLAVDIPSGVDGLTGEAAPHVWHATRTVTFAALKPGLLFGRGKELAGEVEIADIGLAVHETSAQLVERCDVATWWRPRPATDHKWRSSLRVVAGSQGMTGAAELVSHAAMRAGAGMVVLSAPGVEGGGATGEVVGLGVAARGWAHTIVAGAHRFGALVIGPGLGRVPQTAVEVQRLLAQIAGPVVVDADGLAAMAGRLDELRSSPASLVLTPHDGEHESLTGHRPGPDRISAASELAMAANAIVVLKGPSTVVADPAGRVRVMASGDQRLATAGTGDVLAGILGAMLATGVEPFDAAAAAAWIHAEAANTLPARGLVASDLVGAIAEVLGSLA